MTTDQQLDLIEYPESDGKPMTESDPTRDYLVYCVEALDLHFQSRENVYVSGNLFVYYRQGDPKAVVSPDVFVVFGASKRKRRSYQAWKENNKLPDFVMEITSKTTRIEDERDKPSLYAQLGVQEYFQYDPTGDYLQPQLKGFRLVEGQYQPIPVETRPDALLCISSQVLGLELWLIESEFSLLFNFDNGHAIRRELRFFDPNTGEKLPNYKEARQAKAFAELAKEQAELAKEEAEQARDQAEQARDQAEQARDQAEQAKAEAEQARRLAIPRLLALGLTVEQVADALQLSVQQVEILNQNRGDANPT
ncbi:Uma2 family endonuclease [Leptolyngbya sp. 7M]|uniref:Uma2 family endonuclease n=1 Tax=Leptolyngbya sp. 7M TaxID=2812896 RepID=UPI001B8D1563|nr:Uma2 family endonuclease [Leptolyngbya sp. 7M]QYO68327.1 Uma2 family endonuclease [Leptolyngbya sp. 7M]